jgi:hypothetical protein
LDRDFFGEFMDSYRAGKDRYKQERADKQTQALKISEMLGYVPPELEADILGPAQEMPPTLGERAVGGLGRLIGIDNEMGLPPEQFEVPEGQKLSTQYERGIEESERKAQAEALKHKRGLEKLKFESDLETEQLGEQIEEGYKAPELTYEQRLELKKAGSRARGGKLSAREKLQDDLYLGLKTLDDLGPEDYLLLGKYWSSMTPEAMSQEALDYAETIVEARIKASTGEFTDIEINQMVDDLATDFIKKQRRIMNNIKDEQRKDSRKRKGRNLTGNEKPTMDEIWGVR